MKKNTILKTLALPVALAMTMLAASCSSEDNIVDEQQPTAQGGYEIQVTVDVTREGDVASTRAQYNGTTKKLEFTSGDQLFVSGYDETTAGTFSGLLAYDATSGKFSGTIYTQNAFAGSFDDLMASTSSKGALLYPDGYSTYEVLSLSGEAAYNKEIRRDRANRIVSGADCKARAIEQFSYEYTETYSSGFALKPQTAIINCNITDLASTFSDVDDVKVLVKDGNGLYINKTIAKNNQFAFALEQKNYTNLVITISKTDETNPHTVSLGDKTLTAGKVYNVTRTLNGTNVTLSSGSGAITLNNGAVLTGTGGADTHVTIADGATVTLHGVTLTSITNDTDHKWAGITCEGNATIILSGTNAVKGGYQYYPGIYVPSGKTLTIQGSGSLDASSNGWGAGIGSSCGVAITYGGSDALACGNIVIEGGDITATGGDNGAGIGSGGNEAYCGNITISGGTVTARGGARAAGIGSGYGSDCGNITISGGTVTARGGEWCAGIGTGYSAKCGAITITSGVTSVTATKGLDGAPYSIGAAKGGNSTCGKITIGGTEMYAGGGSGGVEPNSGDSYIYNTPAP